MSPSPKPRPKTILYRQEPKSAHTIFTTPQPTDSVKCDWVQSPAQPIYPRRDCTARTSTAPPHYGVQGNQTAMPDRLLSGSLLLLPSLPPSYLPPRSPRASREQQQPRPRLHATRGRTWRPSPSSRTPPCSANRWRPSPLAPRSSPHEGFLILPLPGIVSCFLKSRSVYFVSWIWVDLGVSNGMIRSIVGVWVAVTKLWRIWIILWAGDLGLVA